MVRDMLDVCDVVLFGDKKRACLNSQSKILQENSAGKYKREHAWMSHDLRRWYIAHSLKWRWRWSSNLKSMECNVTCDESNPVTGRGDVIPEPMLLEDVSLYFLNRNPWWEWKSSTFTRFWNLDWMLSGIVTWCNLPTSLLYNAQMNYWQIRRFF